MNTFKNRWVLATTVYWFLLVYIVAALVWWFIALQQQNRQMSGYKLMELRPDDPQYLAKLREVTRAEQRKTGQYIGEGSFFFLFIMVGAVFVYRAVRRQFKVSESQQNFMMAITHELKTPIAVSKLNLETLQKHKLDETKQQKLLETTLQEIERLNTLANNILISSQLEGGGYNMSKEELDISLLAERAVREYQHRFPGRTWNVAIEEDLWLTGDTLLLQIMINNLLENAIKYSPKQSPVTLLLKKLTNSIMLHVIDEGAGIPDAEKKKVFGRFYRMGNEAVRKTKGTGLGLYLCKKIAADHNAEILVTDNPPGGSNFTIRFLL